MQLLRGVSGDLTDIESRVLICHIRHHKTPVVGVTEQGRYPCVTCKKADVKSRSAFWAFSSNRSSSSLSCNLYYLPLCFFICSCLSIILILTTVFEWIRSCVCDVSDSEDIRGDDGSVAKPGDL